MVGEKSNMSGGYEAPSNLETWWSKTSRSLCPQRSGWVSGDRRELRWATYRSNAAHGVDAGAIGRVGARHAVPR